MINLTREEAQQILDFLKTLHVKLSEPEPEPVAYIDVETRNLSWAKLTRWETPTVVKMDKVPLYTAPPKKEWVGLTDEEIKDILDCGRGGLVDIKKAEQKLKDKNT
jgi:hypothetical protein